MANDKKPSLDDIFSEKPAARPSLDQIFSEGPSPAASFGRQTLNAASAGYLPEITAGLVRAGGKVYDTLTGTKDAETYLPSYTQLRDDEYRDLKRDEEVNPKASLGGKLVGGVAGGVALGGGAVKGVTTGAKMLNAAKTGAILGAAYNPGAKEGEIDLLQLKERGKNAAIGGALGGTVQGASNLVSKIPKAGAALSEYAERKAFKATGAKLADTKKALGNDRLEQIGRELLDEKIITVGSTPAKMAESIAQKLDEIGPSIGGIIDKTDEVFQGGAVVDLQRVAKEVADEFNFDQLAKTPGASGAVAKIQNELDILLSNGDALPLKKAWELRRGIDASLKKAYKSKAFDEFPDVEAALLKMRGSIQDQINNSVDEAVSVGAIDGAEGALQGLLKKYSLLSNADSIVTKETARNAANRAIGLTDTIAGGAGLSTGALLSSGDPLTAAATAIAAGAANKAARTYGPNVMALGADKLGKGLQSLSPSVAPIVRRIEKGLSSTKSISGLNSTANSPDLRLFKEVAADEDSMRRRMEKKRGK
jgi:gas vesicle protein